MLLSTPLFSTELLSNNYIQNEDFLINIFKLLTWHYFSLLLSTSMLDSCYGTVDVLSSQRLYIIKPVHHHYWMLFSLADDQARIKRKAISKLIMLTLAYSKITFS